MRKYERLRASHVNDLRTPEVIQFASKAEYACGCLLERYIPNFVLKKEETFQVSIGLNKHCDFRIGNIYLEYHPINLHFEFDDRQALRQLRNALRNVKKTFREQAYDAIKTELAEKYFRRRKMLVDLWTSHSGELIVVQNPTELYRQIIKRFGEGYPREKKFVQEFNSLRDSSGR